MAGRSTLRALLVIVKLQASTVDPLATHARSLAAMAFRIQAALRAFVPPSMAAVHAI
jgi:hypothetical protein